MTFLIPRASLSLSIPVLLLVGFSPFFCMLVFILGLHNVLLAMLIMHWVCMTTVPLVYIYLFEHSFQYYRHVWAIQRCRFRKQWIWGIAFCLITLGFLYLVYYLCAFPYNIFGSNYHWRWFERLLDKIHRNCLQRGLDLSFPLLVLSGLYFFLINPLIEEWFWRVFLYREFGGAVFVAVPNGVLHMKESNPLMISCCMHASHSTVAIPIGEPEEGGEEGREEKETEDKQERERHKEKEEEKRGDSSSSSSLTHPTSATLHDVTEAILRQGSSHAELSSINPIDSSSSSLPVGLPPPSTSPLSHSIPPVVASSHFKTGVKSEEAHPLPSSRSPVGLSPHLNEEKKHERNLFPSRDNEENDEERLPYLSPTSEAPQAFSMQSPHHPPYPPPPLGSSSPTEYFYSLSSPTHDHPAHEVPASSQGERETDENNKKKRPLHGQDSKETEGESRNPLATYTATTSPNAPKTKSTDDGEEGETTVIKMRLPGIGSSPSSFICEEGDEGEGKNEEDDRLRDFSPSCDFAGVLIEKDEKKTSAGNGKKLTEHGEALEEDEEDSCASESPALPSPSAPVITRVGPGILQVDVELSLLGKALLSFFYASYHAVVFATLIDLIYGFLALPIITLLGMILIYLRNTTRFGILSGVLLHVGVDAAVVAVLG
ncbi:caax protease self-immunity protein, partial [Cystoisospora suis]